MAIIGSVWIGFDTKQVTVEAVDRQPTHAGACNYTTTYTLSDGKKLSGAELLGFYTKLS